jgi:hypothetical protein
LVEKRGVDLVLVAARRDGPAFDEMQTHYPDFRLDGILTADAGRGALVLGVVLSWLGSIPPRSLPRQVKSDIPPLSSYNPSMAGNLSGNFAVLKVPQLQSPQW